MTLTWAQAHLDTLDGIKPLSMARSKTFFGLRTGSTKSHTYQVLRGEQITKDRVYRVSNPQSNAQMAQRVKLALVANARSILKDIVNHSFEGVTYGEDSLREFSSLNLKSGALSIASYVPSGISDTGLANFIISKGSLDEVVISNSQATGEDVPEDANGVRYDNIRFAIPNASGAVSVLDVVGNSNTITYGGLCKLLTAIGYPDRSQLTLLGCYRGGKYTYATGSNIEAEGHYHRWYISRLMNDSTLDQNTTSPWTMDQSTTADDKTTITSITISDGYWKVRFNLANSTPEAAIGYAVASMEYQPEGLQNPTLEGATVIYSELVNNVWKRSSQRLFLIPTVESNPNYDQVLYSYLDKTSTTSSAKYLNSGSDTSGLTGGSSDKAAIASSVM